MKIEQQIPRNALAWIVLSQVVLVLPHIPRLPLWVLGIYLATAVHRIMVYQGRWSFPGRWTKAVLTIGCFSAIYTSYGSMLGLEPTVALLLVAFALKLIELSSRKDAYLVIFLAYFVSCAEFLFSQELHIVLYMMLALTTITTALVALHQPGQDRLTVKPMKQASVMLLQAVPLMLLLFFIFPRIGPLWSVPIKSHAAKTGVSDFMSPGDIGLLSKSTEVAFRVEFKGDIPSRSDLYWRGLIFSKVEDDVWSSLGWREIPVLERRGRKPAQLGEKSIAYSVIMEPSQQRWVYSLKYPGEHSRNIMGGGDHRLMSPIEIQDQIRYQVTSYPDAVLDPLLSDWRRQVEVKLPYGSNEKTKDFAVQMRRDYQTDREFVDAVLAYFREQEFFYTLQPPLLGDDSIDEFLFESRKGFCEHYASSFVFLMRAAGIPARVVAGYQGGEVNPLNKSVIVHQFDAHAWTEVWLKGQGWVRVDPTAAVSPDRIIWGLERALAEEGSFLSDSPLSPLRFRDVQWVNILRLRYDALTYAWQRFVLTYDSDRQYDLLTRWLGEFSAARIASVMLIAAAVILLPIFFFLLLTTRPKKLPVILQAYLGFCEKLERVGLLRMPGEAPISYCQRVQSLRPDLAADVGCITELYTTISYQPGANTLDKQRDFLEKIRQFECSKV